LSRRTCTIGDTDGLGCAGHRPRLLQWYQRLVEESDRRAL
jgi:hypothetical protein